jgi:NAD dependent epimerase/dehydratase family enzyme
MAWIHIADWVEMVCWAVMHGAVSGPLNATAPQPVTNREFAKTLGRVLRRPAPLPAPALALRIALGEMADMLLTGQRVLPARAQALGFTFRHPELEPALREIYRRAG